MPVACTNLAQPIPSPCSLCVSRWWGNFLLPGYNARRSFAMVIYILDVRPLIDQLQSNSPAVKQVWYTDNATGAAPCMQWVMCLVGLSPWAQKGLWLPSKCKEDPTRCESLIPWESKAVVCRHKCDTRKATSAWEQPLGLGITWSNMSMRIWTQEIH